MLKFLFSDNESLAQYLDGKYVSFEDVKRHIFLKAREQNTSIPDHLNRFILDNSFKNINSIGNILTIGLEKLVSDYLELDGKRIYVRAEQQNKWQELITYIPPLFLQCVLLQKKTYDFCKKKDWRELQLYLKEYILPNTRYTSIPNARIPQLDYYVNQQNGLHDLHMHLNGALETDQVWQDYLFDPSKVYKDLKKGYKNPKVKEQLEQESSLLEPLSYLNLLKTAQKLRQFFFNHLFDRDEKNNLTKKEKILLTIVDNNSSLLGGYKHPFLQLINTENNFPFLMSIEGLMYILLLHEISNKQSNVLASLFHLYLLILGLTNRLLVQQTHQNGFEQFQKNTLNELRESSEKKYLRRYYQMHGNDLKHIRFLEGRFSPKATQTEMFMILNDIDKGWEKMKKDILLQQQSKSEYPQAPKLKLIAHFIKKEDKKPDEFIRHKQLRYEIYEKGRVLAYLLKNYPKYKEKIVAVDAAASEFDAPPEVFAPVFRLMRRSEIKHFTFHAGEDFYHIIGGLRAVYEAIIFCDLQKGDRIGHATATGLSPSLWGKVIGENLLIKQGDYLDDLIFAYHLIITNRIEALHAILPFIINYVQNLSFQIYNKYYPITVLEQAWLMRQSCPLHTLGKDKSSVKLKNLYCDDEWNFLIENDFFENRHVMESSPIWKLFRKYHDKRYRSKFNKIISINPFEIIKADQIELLQLGLLNEMKKREIIIETLPTSNVRIGFHQNFSSYHLWNWEKWKEEGKSIPPIVVGSDDTGIFATNIYNEYANIYCTLLNDHHLPHSKVMSIIKRLDEDSHIYRFE